MPMLFAYAVVLCYAIRSRNLCDKLYGSYTSYSPHCNEATLDLIEMLSAVRL